MHLVLKGKTFFSKHQDIVALLIFVPAVILFCWKCPFSMGYEDESYYLAVPFRLTMGTSLLTDEWHLAQLAGFLLYLPVKAYVYIVGSTQGIVLFFRYLFVIFQSAVTAVIYCRLKKYGWFGIFAALIYFLYIPNIIMSLNYNTMGLAFVLLTGLLMATTTKHSKATFYIVGLLLSCAVLCNPFLVFVYFLYTSCVIIYEIAKKKGRRIFEFSEPSFSVKTWLWISLGILTMAAIFFAFLFSRTNLKELIDNIPMLFTDPEYRFSSTGSGAQNIFSITKSLYEIVMLSPYSFAAFAVLMFAILIDKKRIAHRKVYLLIVTVIFLAYILAITTSLDAGAFKFASAENLLYCTFPLSLVGLACYILTIDKNKKTFIFLWVLGILYSICLDITSDLGTLSSIQGFAVLNTASIIFIKNIYDELQKDKNGIIQKPYKQPKNLKNNKILTNKLVLSALIATIFFQIGVEYYISASYNLTSVEYAIGNSAEGLSETIQAGPLMGLRTVPKREKMYSNILTDLSVIKEKNDGNVLVVGDFQWCYLYLDMPYATYSTYLLDWFYASQNRLPQYYKLHPESKPDYIYISKIVPRFYSYEPGPAKNVLDDILDKCTCTVEESDVGYIVEIRK